MPDFPNNYFGDRLPEELQRYALGAQSPANDQYYYTMRTSNIKKEKSDPILCIDQHHRTSSKLLFDWSASTSPDPRTADRPGCGGEGGLSDDVMIGAVGQSPKKARAKETSRHFGVRFRPDLKKWVAEIRVAEWKLVDKKVWLGTFETEEGAARAVDAARKLLKCRKNRSPNFPCSELDAYAEHIPAHLVLTNLQDDSMFKDVTAFVKSKAQEYAATSSCCNISTITSSDDQAPAANYAETFALQDASFSTFYASNVIAQVGCIIDMEEDWLSPTSTSSEGTSPEEVATSSDQLQLCNFDDDDSWYEYCPRTGQEMAMSGNDPQRVNVEDQSIEGAGWTAQLQHNSLNHVRGISRLGGGYLCEGLSDPWQLPESEPNLQTFPDDGDEFFQDAQTANMNMDYDIVAPGDDVNLLQYEESAHNVQAYINSNLGDATSFMFADCMHPPNLMNSLHQARVANSMVSC